MTRAFGMELVLDLGGCDPDVLGDPDALHTWAMKLCDLIGMTPYGHPFVDYFGKDDLAGWTLIQPITTSSIAVHCAPGRRYGDAAFVNIFSCRPFDTDQAAGYTAKFFRAERIHQTVLERAAPG